MRFSPWFVVAGAVAGFAGVLGFDHRAAVPAARGPAHTPSPSVPVPARTGPTPAPARTGAPSRPGEADSYRSATGPAEQFGYGSIAVRVTVEGNRITSVPVVSLQTLEPTSQQISTAAIPVLRSEVLSAQSAAISAVSGATYTSQAYDQSLQAALDKLHAA